LGQEACAAIQAVAETGKRHVSAITPWEIALLVGKARLRFCCDVGEWMERALK
jgi:PIN domain nuclease of toxin-antitoxin system